MKQLKNCDFSFYNKQIIITYYNHIKSHNSFSDNHELEFLNSVKILEIVIKS